MPATAVKDHPDVQEAKNRLVSLRRRRNELQEERKAARSAEPDLDAMAEEYDGRLDQDSRSVAEIQEELKVVKTAIHKARERRQHAKADAKAEILEELSGPYREAMRRLARQVRALLREAEAERKIREEARDRGLKPAAVNAFHPLPERVLRDWLETAENDYDI